MCRGRSCANWLEGGFFTCAELHSISCPCDGCCEHSAPPAPPPLTPSCGEACRDKTCFDRLEFGQVTCNELRDLDFFRCPCDGCPQHAADAAARAAGAAADAAALAAAEPGPVAAAARPARAAGGAPDPPHAPSPLPPPDRRRRRRRRRADAAVAPRAGVPADVPRQDLPRVFEVGSFTCSELGLLVPVRRRCAADPPAPPAPPAARPVRARTHRRRAAHRAPHTAPHTAPRAPTAARPPAPRAAPMSEVVQILSIIGYILAGLLALACGVACAVLGFIWKHYMRPVLRPVSPRLSGFGFDPNAFDGLNDTELAELADESRHTSWVPPAAEILSLFAPTPRRADHHSNGENGGENGGAAATRRPRGIMPAAFRARKYSHVSESPDAPETPGGIRAVVADDAEELRIAPIVSCSQAWLATQGEAGAEVSDLDIETLLRAFSITSRIGESLGAMMTLAVKNDEANFEKVRVVWSQLGRPMTLRALLEAEVATGVHKRGGVLADPSAAMSFLWLRRTLQFLAGIIERLCGTNREVAMKDVARASYAEHLEPYHSWLLRNTFRMGMSGLPKRDDVFAKLRAPGSDDEALLLEQMRECSEQMNVTISLMRGLYLELDLEDVRKV